MGCVCHPWVLSDRNMGGSAELWLTMDETGFIEPVGSPAVDTTGRKWGTGTGAGSRSPPFPPVLGTKQKLKLYEVQVPHECQGLRLPCPRPYPGDREGREGSGYVFPVG